MTNLATTIYDRATDHDIPAPNAAELQAAAAHDQRRQAAMDALDLIGARAVGALEVIVKERLLAAKFPPVHATAEKIVAEWHAAFMEAKR